jgi:hypothetical protein
LLAIVLEAAFCSVFALASATFFRLIVCFENKHKSHQNGRKITKLISCFLSNPLFCIA